MSPRAGPQAVTRDREAAEVKPAPHRTALPAAGGPLTVTVSTFKRAVYTKLRDMIVWFELPPGERLVESELAARLGVSKTPVREALALLEADSLVRSLPYRGAYVKWLSLVELKEQGFLVDALEIPAFPLVVQGVSRTEMAAIGRLMEQLKRARRTRDERRFGSLVLDMHARLFAPVEFPRLRKLISTVVGPVGLRYDKALVYSFDDAWDVYMKLTVGRYELLRDGDPDGAAVLVRRYRAELDEMAEARVSDPKVAQYFRTD